MQRPHQIPLTSSFGCIHGDECGYLSFNMFFLSINLPVIVHQVISNNPYSFLNSLSWNWLWVAFIRDYPCGVSWSWLLDSYKAFLFTSIISCTLWFPLIHKFWIMTSQFDNDSLSSFFSVPFPYKCFKFIITMFYILKTSYDHI